MEIVWFILIGIAAGFIASHLMKAGGYGLVGDLVIGLVGAVAGGYVLRLIGLAPTSPLGRLVTATVGAMLFIGLIRFIRRKVR